MRVGDHPISPEELMAYLDGEAPQSALLRTAEHLRYCRECQAMAADLQAVTRVLTEWEATAPGAATSCPASLPTASRWGSLVNARRFWTEYGLQSLCGLAVLVLAAGIGHYYGRTSWESRRTPASSASVTYHPAYAAGRSLEDAPADGSRLASFASEAGKSQSRLQVPSMPASQDEPAAQTTIARTAELRIIVTNFGQVRAALMKAVDASQGYVSRLDISEQASEGRTLIATVRIPAQRLDATLAEIKRLGRVKSESQSAEDVARQIVDVGARLTNLRAEEDRLNQILRERTGKLSDVLMVEEQISRVRGQIETSQAEQKNIQGRVVYASLTVSMVEEYTKTLLSSEAPSTLHVLKNAATEGVSRLAGFCLDLLIFLLSNGPLLLLLAGTAFGLYKLYRWFRLSQGSTG